MKFRYCSLLILALLCGCSDSEDELIGEWSAPKFAHITPQRIIFSADGTAIVQRDRSYPLEMKWRRLDRGRFTLVQADGEMWRGCLVEGVINVRMPHEVGRPRIHRLIRHGRDARSASSGLTCKP